MVKSSNAPKIPTFSVKAYNIFLRTIKFADYYRNTKTNIYFFIKDCLFQRIFKVYGNRFPSSDCQNLFNIFQMEMKQSQWKRNNISKQEYQQYLEETENVGIFGAFDDLTNQRVKYFNNKIIAFKQNPKQNTKTTSIFKIFQKGGTQIGAHAQHKNLMPQNTPQNNNQVVDLPDVSKDNKKKPKIDPDVSKDNKKKPKIDPDMERLNNLMKQMKMNSPIYITNVQPGQFYNPYTMPNYIPKGVNTNIPLPMRKQDPNYQHLKAIIEKELILANQELDYHKIDMARNHLERAAYYLKNVID